MMTVELGGHATFVIVGMIGAWSFHCFLSDPHMMEHFYEFTAGDPAAKPDHPALWSNILNYITITRLVSNFLTQSLNLSHLCQPRPMLPRIHGGLAAIIGVLLIPIIVTCVRVDEVTTFALVLAAVACSGIATGFQQATLFSLGSLFPDVAYAQSALVGMAGSAALASYVKVATKGSFGSSFHDQLQEARMYYGLGIALVLLAMVALVLFARTTYARVNVPELQSTNEKPPETANDEAAALLIQDVETPVVEPERTFCELLFELRWLGAANALVFVASFCIFPGVLARIEPHDTWFKILIVLAFQTALTIGRLGARWVARLVGDVGLDGRVLTLGALLRAVIFVPLFVFGFAKGHGTQAGAYVAISVCQLLAGVLSGLISIAVPRHPVASTTAAKARAGNLLSLGILVASTLGTLANLAVCHWYL